ncbi:MAG: DUF1565 domain-containing protein [FCB group bacterium]|nr:DUF1565 domain-containing protein [FCB group bacterium]
MNKFICSLAFFISVVSAATVSIPADFSHIQDGIFAAGDGDTVLVYPGIYTEQINLEGKSILLTSLYSVTGYSGYITATVIDGGGAGSVVTFNHGEGQNSVLAGFTITGGMAANGGGGFISQASPLIKNVLITGNTAAEKGGGLVCYFMSEPLLMNLTITDNSAGENGGGIFCRDNSQPGIVNSIIWNNTLTSGTVDNVELNLGSSAVFAYSTLEGGDQDVLLDYGTLYYLSGNLETDPQFNASWNGDFSLLESSPCIDAGVTSMALYFNGNADSLLVPEVGYSGEAPDQGALEQAGISGCMDSQAVNFLPEATLDDGSCAFAPQLDPLEDMSTAEDVPLQILLTASDQNTEDNLVFSAAADTSAVLPTVLEDTLYMSPAPNWYGSSIITVFVSDGDNADSSSFVLVVTPVNDPPSVDCGEGAAIGENMTLTDYTLSAEDVDGDSLSWEIEVGANFDNFPWVTDTFTWDLIDSLISLTPPSNWYGVADVQVRVSDAALVDTCDFNLTVLSAENDVHLSFGEIDYADRTLAIIMENQPPVSGFQFLVGDPHFLTIEDVFGGAAGDHDFILQFEPANGMVLGFSQVLDALPPGESVLTYLQFSGWGTAETCLQDITVTSPDGSEAFIIPGDCIMLNFDPGDVNDDGAADILDVVEIVAIILGQIAPNEYETWAADLNADGAINVSDVILLIDLIMEYRTP